MRIVTRITFLPAVGVILVLAALLLTGPLALSLQHPARIKVARTQRPAAALAESPTEGAQAAVTPAAGAPTATEGGRTKEAPPAAGEGVAHAALGGMPPAFVASEQKTVGAIAAVGGGAKAAEANATAGQTEAKGSPADSKATAPSSIIAPETAASKPDASSSSSQPADSNQPSPASQPPAAPARTCAWSKYADWPYVPESKLSPYRKKLIYIKTPKSSSSTVAHILQRWTYRHAMVLGYPTFSGLDFTLETDEEVRRSVERAGVKHVDAFVSHMVYNASSIQRALGVDRPFRIASLREPVARSWSMFLHGMAWNLSEFTRGGNTPMQFARNVKHDSQFNYVTGYGENGLDDPKTAADHFDHFVLSHRVVESLAALAPKIGLTASDLLFFNQKTEMSTKKASDFVTPAEKKLVDAELRLKTKKDREIFDIATGRLDRELAGLTPQVAAILRDVPQMKRELAKECGHIDLEDNSCVGKGEIVWDGGAMCSTRCIQRWADANIRCMK